MNKKFKTLAFAVLLSSQIHASVIGIEKRQLSTPGNLRHAEFIGRFDIGCTGIRLTPALILTNLHCLVEESDNENQPLTFRRDLGPFRAQLVANKSTFVANPIRVWFQKVTNNPRANPDRDWAIILLDKPLDVPSKAGRQTLLDLPEVVQEKERLRIENMTLPFTRVMLAGYSGDLDRGNSPALDPYCTIDKQIFLNEASEPNRYAQLHDCQFEKGASGGPLFVLQEGRYKLIAMAQSQYIPDENDDLSEAIFPGDKSGRAPNVGIALPITVIYKHIETVRDFVGAIGLNDKKKYKRELDDLGIESRSLQIVSESEF